jgi:hypothetical protein
MLVTFLFCVFAFFCVLTVLAEIEGNRLIAFASGLEAVALGFITYVLL